MGHDLHSKLPGSERYLGKIIVAKESDIPLEDPDLYLTKHQDFMLRSKNVDKHAGIVVTYFCSKVENFIEKVLKITLGVTDYLIRYEFQNRGSIHAHCLLRTLNGPGENQMALVQGNPVPSEVAEKLKDIKKLQKEI